MTKRAKSKLAKRRQPTRKSRPASRRSRPKTALMRIKHPPEQSWALTLDEVALVRNHIAKGSTDEELKFCLAVARRRKLDPFKGQIWFVKIDGLGNSQNQRRQATRSDHCGIVHIGIADF